MNEEQLLKKVKITIQEIGIEFKSYDSKIISNDMHRTGGKLIIISSCDVSNLTGFEFEVTPDFQIEKLKVKSYYFCKVNFEVKLLNAHPSKNYDENSRILSQLIGLKLDEDIFRKTGY